MKGFAERLLGKLGIRKRLTYKAEELQARLEDWIER